MLHECTCARCKVQISFLTKSEAKVKCILLLQLQEEVERWRLNQTLQYFINKCSISNKQRRHPGLRADQRAAGPPVRARRREGGRCAALHRVVAVLLRARRAVGRLAGRGRIRLWVKILPQALLIAKSRRWLLSDPLQQYAVYPSTPCLVRASF